MARSRLLQSCVLASIFLYCTVLHFRAWLANDGRSCLLAERALGTARDSVYAAMQSLFVAHEDTSKRNPAADTRFEQLQASFDKPELHRQPSFPSDSEEPLDLAQHQAARTHHSDICESLAGKRVTMVGGEHIYRLHVLLLQHRERTEGKPFHCPYHEFCTHHHICFLDQHFRADASPPRYIKPPTAQELVDTESAAVNYIVSDSLCSVRNESSLEYTSPFVDPTTGVRLRETYWLAAARKANILILGRGPLSAPGQTYTGNWSFLHHLPDFLNGSRARVANRYGTRADVHMVRATPRSLDILNAAVHLTVSRFLPDIFQLLQSIKREVRPGRQKRLVWPSSWYRLPGRGVAQTALLSTHMLRHHHHHHHRQPWSSTQHALILQLSALLDADATHTSHLEDPWTLLFNAQVYLQNTVLRELLPRHGIVFLPLDVPWVEGRRRGSASDVDLARTTSIGEAFLAGMDYTLRYLE